jgi:hypothetical protein
MKKTADIVVSVATVVWNIGQWNCRSRRLWLHPNRTQNSQGFCLRTDFRLGTTSQSILQLQSGSSNGGEGGKTNRFLTILPDIALADFVLCWREKRELDHLSLSWQSFQTSCDEIVWAIAEDAFCRCLGWTAANSTSAWPLTRQKIILR